MTNPAPLPLTKDDVAKLRTLLDAVENELDPAICEYIMSDPERALFEFMMPGAWRLTEALEAAWAENERYVNIGQNTANAWADEVKRLREENARYKTVAFQAQEMAKEQMARAEALLEQLKYEHSMRQKMVDHQLCKE